MKKCPVCKIVKQLDDFPIATLRADGRGSTCLLCKRGMDRDYYSRNRPKFRQRNIQTIQNSKLKLIQYLQDNPCVDCGEVDILVLEFDHRRGSPTTRVSNMVGQGSTWPSILKEIEKCDVRCANCHSRVTRMRANDWRWQLSLEQNNVPAS